MRGAAAAYASMRTPPSSSRDQSGTKEVVANARVTRFIHWLWDRGVRAESYDDLWRWSVTEVDDFWDAIWSYFDVVGERGDGPVREGGPMPVDGLRWFPGASLNYAANALRRAEDTPVSTPA